MVDVNAHYAVGDVLHEAGAEVHWANRRFPIGTPDDEIDRFSRNEGRIVISHDRRFLQKIQQRRFQSDLPASTGYGRILLCGREDRQPDRLREVLPLLIVIHDWAVETDHRFIVTISDTWIRFDDKPIARSIYSELQNG